MDWTIYGALIAGFLAVSGGITFLVIRVLQAWRAFKRLRRHTAKELDRLAQLTEEMADNAASATESPRLNESLARLRLTLARFAVLRAAVDEATDTFGRFAAVYPRK
jgi:ethanolamine ammonia-lyase small subunit